MKEIDTICANLVRAFDEQKEDYLSLITIIDLYATQVNQKGSLKNKEQFLSTLLETLEKNRSIIVQIGWDLPKPLLKFISIENIDMLQPLFQSKVLSMVMKSFNEIALNGNAKECFFTGCECLGNLKLNGDSDNETGDEEEEEEEEEGEEEEEEEEEEDNSDDNDREEEGEKGEEHSSNQKDNSRESVEKYEINYSNTEKSFYSAENIEDNIHRRPDEFILDLKAHLLFELISSTNKRIHTLYPSRFLGMAAGAIFKFVRNLTTDADDANFLLRRIYTYCRGYIPPDPPAQLPESISAEEVNTIKCDEAVLQGKLLCSLLTFGLGQCLKTKNPRWTVRYFSALRGTEFTESDYYVALSGILFRYYQLAISFDINIKEEFIRLCIKESRRIYQSLPMDEKIVNDEAKSAISQVVYHLSRNYELQKMANEKDLPLDPLGILFMATSYFSETGKPLVQEIQIDDAIYMYLRFSTPIILSAVPDSPSTIDSIQFWLWVAIMNSPYQLNKERLKSLPSYVNMVFLQVLLVNTCNQPNNEMRMVEFTLLTRILCLMPESLAFNFILDTLLTCPLEHAKCCVLGILKDLMLRNYSTTHEVNEDFSKLNISSDEKNDAKKVPKLPPRPYILVNENRMASIHSLAMMTIESAKSKNQPSLNLLLAYLNFLVGLREKWDKMLLQDVNDEATLLLKEFSTETTPEMGFIRIANNNLTEFLTQDS